jgi:hypothetical protein
MFSAVMNLANMGANGYSLIDTAYHFDTRKQEPVTDHVQRKLAELVLKQAPTSCAIDASQLLECLSTNNLPFSAAVLSILVHESIRLDCHLNQCAAILSRKIHSDVERDTGSFLRHALMSSVVPHQSTFGHLSFPQVHVHSTNEYPPLSPVVHLLLSLAGVVCVG